MTIRILIGGAMAAASLGLIGCSQNQAAASQTATLVADRYCTPFQKVANTGAPAAAVATDPASAFEDCLHRWGYALAPARDPADVVAQAAVAECSTYLTQWNQAALAQSPQGSPERGVSLTTGRPTDLMAQRAQYASNRALFYIVQARAGRCAAPPPEQMSELAAPPPTSAAPTGQAAQTPTSPLAPPPEGRSGVG